MMSRLFYADGSACEGRVRVPGDRMQLFWNDQLCPLRDFRLCFPAVPVRLMMAISKTYVSVVYSSLGVILGVSALLVWNIVYKQPWTGAMGGLSGDATHSKHASVNYRSGFFSKCMSAAR